MLLIAPAVLPSEPPRHVRAAGLALLVVVLLHAVALDAMAPRLGPAINAVAQPQATMQVRQILQSPAPARLAATEAAPSPTKPATRARLKADAAPAATPAAPTVGSATEDPAQPAASTAAAPANTPIPTYATSPAPAATLVFDVRRGLASGQSTLSWRPENGAYTVTMNNEAFGVGALSWASRGVLDADGLAPERYSEIRNRREVRSTNFQRDALGGAGKVSFSAQSHEYPLTPGVQDRVSWMLQLAAVLQANPHLSAPGASLTLAVVGTRGAPEPWVFTVQERSSEPTLANTVHLLREPRRPYDLRVNIWLDPARQHLPVRAQLVVHATGEGHEFNLAELTWY